MSTPFEDSRWTARRPAGPAGGVFDGFYPNPSWGLPMGGIRLEDDFVGAISKTNMRTQLGWSVSDIAGGVAVSGAEDTATEHGVIDMVTAGGLGDGGNMGYADGRLIGGIPVGLKWGVKIRSRNVAGHNQNVRVWSGWSDTANGDWLVAGGVQCVGIRVIAAGAAVHYFGVCKVGAGAGNETTVDLGYDYDGTWRFLGFRRTTTGIQFCRWDASLLSTYGLLYENLDSEVTTNIPAVDLYPIGVGLDAAAAAQKAVQVDWWGAGGAVPR
jgi:hypothetical protein